MKEKEGKRGKKKIIRSQETTRTHALHLLENEFNKMLRDFYIHRLLISHFFFSCILRFPNHIHVYFSSLILISSPRLISLSFPILILIF